MELPNPVVIAKPKRTYIDIETKMNACTYAAVHGVRPAAIKFKSKPNNIRSWRSNREALWSPLSKKKHSTTAQRESWNRVQTI